jgi:SAM-dependent methyltransferase
MRDLTRERYYEDRARVYDATSYRGDLRINVGLDRETAEIGARLTALSAGRVLEVGCGTAVWTQFLRGVVVAMDQSAAMLEIARTRVPEAMLIRALVRRCPLSTTASIVCSPPTFTGCFERRSGHCSWPMYPGSPGS